MAKEKLEAIKSRQAVARDKLKSAKILFENRQYKDCVSMAYYAMYYAAVALLITKNQTPKSHQGVLSLFGQYFVKQGEIDKVYALMIRVIKEMREDADYKPEVKINKQEANEVIVKAKKFIKKSNQIINQYIEC